MRKAALVVALAWTSFAAAQDDTLSDEEQNGLTLMIKTFARCAGVYEVTAEYFKSTDQPATAEHVHNLANGAHSSAIYLLGQENVAKGGPPRRYGDFKPYVDGIKETAMTYMRGLAERGETQQFLAEFQSCAELAPAQEELVQKMRDETVGR